MADARSPAWPGMTCNYSWMTSHKQQSLLEHFHIACIRLQISYDGLNSLDAAGSPRCRQHPENAIQARNSDREAAASSEYKLCHSERLLQDYVHSDGRPCLILHARYACPLTRSTIRELRVYQSIKHAKKLLNESVPDDKTRYAP